LLLGAAILNIKEHGRDERFTIPFYITYDGHKVRNRDREEK
jgi:hypothetical protein